MDEAVIKGVSSSWQATCAREGPLLALSQLCAELGRHTAKDSARFLAAHALGLAPNHAEALALLEQTTPDEDQLSLCLHYERFLASAPDDDDARAVRERLVSLLFEHALHYSALLHVDDALTELSVAAPSDDAIAHACAPFVQRSMRELSSALEELEFARFADDELTISVAAE